MHPAPHPAFRSPPPLNRATFTTSACLRALLPLGLCALASSAWAQAAGAGSGAAAQPALAAATASPSTAKPSSDSTSKPSPALKNQLLNLEQLAPPPAQPVELIENEDRLTRTQELRVGGEIRRANVQPRAGGPSYDLPGNDGARYGLGLDKRPQPSLFNLLRF